MIHRLLINCINGSFIYNLIYHKYTNGGFITGGSVGVGVWTNITTSILGTNNEYQIFGDVITDIDTEVFSCISYNTTNPSGFSVTT